MGAEGSGRVQTSDTRPTTFGVQLRRLRRQYGFTQEELARAARVPQDHISQLETGRIQRPGVLYGQQLAEALETTVEELMRP